jgi:outer membrane protein TolC
VLLHETAAGHVIELGQANELDVLTQESQMAQNEAAVPPLEKQLAQQRDLITALAGRFPADEVAAKVELNSLQLPAELPVSLPSLS